MKKTLKYLALAIVALLLFVSCGSSRVVKEAERTFRGDWVLNNVTYPGNTGNFNVTLFNDAKAECFLNSRWNFVANNNTGTYIINDTSCSTGDRHFRWYVQEVNADTDNYDFLFKPTDDRNRSVNNNAGFRINLVLLNETRMIWEQTVSFEGSPFTIRMEFNKA